MDGRDLNDDEHEAAVGAIGLQGVFALAWLTSWYSMFALQLDVLRAPLRERETVGIERAIGWSRS